MRDLVAAQIRSRLLATAGLAFGGFALMFVMAITFETLGTDLLGGADADASSALDAFGGPGGTDILSPGGWVGLGFNHPIMLVIAMTGGVTIGAGAVAGMIDSGQGEMLFTRPLRRPAFLHAALAVWVVCELVVLTAAGLGAIVGGAFTESIRELGLWRLLLPLPELFALGALIGAVALLASTRSKTAGRAAGVAIAIAVVSYLLSFMSGLSGSLDWVRWITPFGYFDPGSAINEGVDPLHVAVLGGLAAILYLLALREVGRRDLV